MPQITEKRGEAPNTTLLEKIFIELGRTIGHIHGLFRPANPVVNSFIPIQGFGGTSVEINGANFSSTRSDNQVRIGGAEAIVVEASATRLRVLAGLKTGSGPVEVTVAGRQGKGPHDFQALKYPAPGSKDDGPPTLYIGAGKGEAGHAPVTGNTRLLIVPCYPADRTPGNLTNAHTAISNLFTQADTYYHQVSYDALDFAITYANWHKLSGNYADYVPAGSDNIDNPNGLNRLTAEAANAAEAAGWDLDNFDIMGVVFFTNGFTLRGWGGWPQSSFSYSNPGLGLNINISVGHNVYLLAVAEASDWGRCAHEIGHCLVEGNVTQTGIKPEDVYSDAPSDLEVVATAESFDLMGSHDERPLYSGFYMQQLGYYSNANIVELTWDRNPFPAAGQTPVTYELVAHGASQNTNPNRFHLIRIKVADALYYYIEIRQRPDPAASPAQVFDASIPLNGVGTMQGGVVVTKVFTGLINMNQQIRFITLMHDVRVLRQGDVVTDPLRDLRISVTNDNVAAWPLVCRVQVEWAQNIAPDPNGKFDLQIKPWDSNYQTEDIWIDHQPWKVYDHHDAAGNPVGNGDRPCVNLVNQFWGRVSNQGSDPATGVRLTYYAVEPPGVGDNGNWGPLGTKTFASIASGAKAEDYVPWTPTVGRHTCLKLVAETQLGEVSVSNNSAQENVSEFDAPSSSVPDPVRMAFAVRNPLKKPALALLHMRGLPEGFIAQVPHSWVWLGPLEERLMELTVVPLYDLALYTRKEIVTANLKVDGRIPHVYQRRIEPGGYPPSILRPMGGILVQITPKRRCQLDLREDRESRGEERIALLGAVTPATAGQPVNVNLIDPKSRLRVEQAYTDGSGRFRAVFDLTRAPEDGEREDPLAGIYIGQAFVLNAPKIAEAESGVVYVQR